MYSISSAEPGCASVARDVGACGCDAAPRRSAYIPSVPSVCRYRIRTRARRRAEPGCGSTYAHPHRSCGGVDVAAPTQGPRSTPRRARVRIDVRARVYHQMWELVCACARARARVCVCVRA
jgi:hypothetical protein